MILDCIKQVNSKSVKLDKIGFNMLK
jgi:hypothetical protein